MNGISVNGIAYGVVADADPATESTVEAGTTSGYREPVVLS